MFNSMATSYAYGSVSGGAAVSGEGTLRITPKIRPAQPKPGVQFVHGAGSDATYCISPLGNQNTLTQQIAAAGFSGTSGDNGGPNTWGNFTSLQRLDAQYGAIQAMPGIKKGKIALISGSMGGLISMNWAASNKAKVSCIVSVIPVCNINDIAVNNRAGYGPTIQAAYPGGWSEATYGSGYNPFTMSKLGKLAGIPMLFFYGQTDTLCLPTWPEQMVEHAGNDITLVPMSSGHDWDSYATVDQPRIVEFLKQHNV